MFQNILRRRKTTKTPSFFFKKESRPLDLAPIKGSSPLMWQHYNLFFQSLPKQLHWADRDAMAHSIEARIPFLDQRVVEQCLQSSPLTLFKDGWSKVKIRKGLSAILPTMISKRTSKIGFPSTVASALFEADDIIRYIQDHLKDCHFDKETLTRLLTMLHTKENPSLLFKLLTLILWKEIFQVDFTPQES